MGKKPAPPTRRQLLNAIQRYVSAQRARWDAELSGQDRAAEEAVERETRRLYTTVDALFAEHAKP